MPLAGNKCLFRILRINGTKPFIEFYNLRVGMREW